MDLDQLQSVRDRERASDDLQELRESFYADATTFIGDLRAERAAAADEADDPFDSPRVTRLTDRIRTAEQTLEAIYEKRVGKVVKAATFAAADLPAEAEGMTVEEAELFETLVAEIEANREEVLGDVSDASDGIPGTDDGGGDVPAANAMGGGNGAVIPEDDAPAPPDTDDGTQAPPDTDDSASAQPDTDDGASAQPDTDAESQAPEPTEAEAADSTPPAEPTVDDIDSDGDTGPDEDATPDGDADHDDEASANEGVDRPDVDRQLVRITDDVGAILGVDDREYDLAEDDVVTLPAANAKPLIEQGAAEPLE